MVAASWVPDRRVPPTRRRRASRRARGQLRACVDSPPRRPRATAAISSTARCAPAGNAASTALPTGTRRLSAPSRPSTPLPHCCRHPASRTPAPPPRPGRSSSPAGRSRRPPGGRAGHRVRRNAPHGTAPPAATASARASRSASSVGGRSTARSTWPRTASKRSSSGRAIIWYPISLVPAGREITISTRRRPPGTAAVLARSATSRARLTPASPSAAGPAGSRISSHGNPSSPGDADRNTSSSFPSRARW
jgi:hypothetical protein